MSIIARQSVKFSIISYFGYAIGILASVFLYPYDFDFSGKIQIVLSYAELLSPFILFGLSASIMKFNPELKQKNATQSFFTFGIIIIILNSGLAFLAFKLLQIFFPKLIQTDLLQFSTYIFPLILLLSLAQLYTRYINNFYRIVVPNLLSNILPKLGSITAFTLFYFWHCSQHFSLSVFVTFHLLIVVFIVLYLKNLEPNSYSFQFNFLTEISFRKSIINYSLFAIIGGIGSIITTRIDKIMIGQFISDESVGVYSNFVALLTLVTIPAVALYTVATPKIVEFISKNDIISLQKMYHKSSLALFFVASFILCIIFSGAEGLFDLMKNGQKLLAIFPVLYILGFAVLFDVATGFNSQILTYSNYYKFNMILIFVLALVSIILNFFFLYNTSLGIFGVAIANFMSMFVFNVIKCTFIYRKFGIYPFSFAYLYVLIAMLLSLSVNYFFQFTLWYENLLIKPALVLVIFIICNSFFKIIPFKELYQNNLKSFLTGK